MSATATASDYGVQADENRWLGVDFSGDKRKWSLRCSNSNVWIAEIRPADGATRLVDLKRVQELRGTSDPFQRLASHLSERSFLAAAIDAPFSVSSEFLPKGGHKALLDLVANLPLNKTFPDAQAFADSVIMGRQMTFQNLFEKQKKHGRKEALTCAQRAGL